MTADGTTEWAARIARDGYATVRTAIEPDRVARWRDALDAAFQREAAVAAERGWLTDSYRVSYALAAKDPTFVDACTDPVLVDAAAAVLGGEARVAGCNGLDVVAGGTAQRLHADHPTPTPGVTLYLHLVCALDPFTAANGATRVVPGSHRRNPDSTEDPTRREADAQVVEVEAGDIVAFDGTLWHAAGANRTDRPRRALHLFYCRPWVRPHWDFPRSIPAVAADRLTARQRRLLGFEDGPARWDTQRGRDIR